MDSINILVEAKKEYTNQLQKILTPRLHEGFKSIYEDIINLISKELEENKPQNSSIVKTFQKTLKEIPQWNQEMIKKEYSRIEKLSNCDYFDNLIEAVFITNTKILTSVQINDTKSKNIKINIPQPCYFIHKCYMECAKEIYKNPYIFDQSRNLTPKEKHNNLRESLSLIDNSINNAIRDLLPIRDILKQGLIRNAENFEENEESDQIDDENDSTENSIIDDDNSIIEDNHNNNNIEDNDNNIIENNNNILENNNNSSDEIKYESNENISEEIIKDPIILDETINSSISPDSIKNIKIEENENINLIGSIDFDKSIINEKVEINENIVDLNNDINDENIDDSENNDNELIIPEEKEQGEIKKIIYSTPTNNSKKTSKNIIPQISKFDNSNIINNSNIIFEKKINNDNLINNEIIEKANNLILENQEEFNNDKTEKNNPFIKTVKNTKFLKSKYLGLDKSNSFYKKKYEENSANYQSMSENINGIKTDDVKITELSFNPVKIVKNKIILNGGNSSDEEDEEEEINL